MEKSQRAKIIFMFARGWVIKPLCITLTAILVLLTIGTTAVLAGGMPESPQWEVIPNFRLWGIDLAVGYHGMQIFPGTDTGLWFALGGGKEDAYFYRNPDGTLYTRPDGTVNLANYKTVNYAWALGIRQGLLYDPLKQRNLIEAFLLYKGRSDRNFAGESPAGSLVFQSGLADKDGIDQHVFILGLGFNGVTAAETNFIKSGLAGELAFELAPQGLNKIADYQRISFSGVGFLPLCETDDHRIYLADRIAFDHLDGNYIPINARTSLGGSNLVPLPAGFGLGGGIRGLDNGRFDGYVKLLNNLELRMSFPRLGGAKLIPGLLVYGDIGLSDNLTKKLDFGKTYATAGIGLTAHEEYTFFRANYILYYQHSFEDRSANIGFAWEYHF